MRLPLLLAVVFVLALAGGAGYVAIEQRFGVSVDGFANASRPLFPRLAPAEVARIDIAESHDHTTLVRTAGGWGIAGYGRAAAAAKVEDLLRRIAALRALYVSDTATPPYAEYGLDAPASEPRNSVRIVLRDHAGQPIAGLTLGNTLALPGGSSIGKMYVREAGKPNALIVDASFRVDSSPSAWLAGVDTSGPGRADLSGPAG